MAVQAERRTPLNRDRVLQAAMKLADDGGIDSLSMRKLGQSLGVEAMSLYNHVANKDDLLDGIVHLVWGEIELPADEEDWETAIRRCAISAHDALVRHTWACNLIMSSMKGLSSRLRYMESLMRALRRASFSPEETYHAYHALDSHILGFTLWQAGHAIDEAKLASFMQSFWQHFPRVQYPCVAEHGELHFSEGSHKDEGEFEFGLKLILDGLKRMRSGV